MRVFWCLARLSGFVRSRLDEASIRPLLVAVVRKRVLTAVRKNVEIISFPTPRSLQNSLKSCEIPEKLPVFWCF